jgi:hypothetical protein
MVEIAFVKLIVAKGMVDVNKFANKRPMDNGVADAEMASNWAQTRKVAKVGKRNNIEWNN